MTATRVTIRCSGLELEGMLERVAGRQGVVVTHPHPLYGGDMDNPVVLAVCRAFRRKGFSTLRFNFRGHDRGVGECDDVRAAGAFLSEQDVTEIDLAGYSFGAWVNAAAGAGFRRLVMVSPPLAFIDFKPLAPLANLHLIVTGSRDEIAPPGLIEAAR
ncbi:MAG: alpha/beta hydrolase, partial [Desulfobacterales bacterium]|nr:alpha/beta hydrolase [Desulfobacterales bacterium]